MELNDSLCAIKHVERYVVNIWTLIDRQKGNWRKEFVITIPEGDMMQFHTLGNFLSYIHEGELVFCSKQGIIVYTIMQDSYKREEESSRRLQTVSGHITFYFDTTFSVIQYVNMRNFCTLVIRCDTLNEAYVNPGMCL